MLKKLFLMVVLGVFAASLAGCYYQKTDKRTGKTQSISAQEYDQLNR